MFSLLFLFLLPGAALAAGGSSPQGKWTVTNSTTGIPCIIVYSQIDLDLSYIVKESDAEKDVYITVPSTSTVSQASHCGHNYPVGSTQIFSQVMRIDFDHMSDWYLLLYFTTDHRLPTDNGKQWALYRVDVHANYASQADLFPNAADSNHTYTNVVTLDSDNEFADYIYAPLNNCLYCPSKQKYIINTDTSVGPRATITFSLLQVQAYMAVKATGLMPFGNRQTCPTDQHTTDKVPIIVGGCLAGLIILTMILYLVYRACLPEEIIQLTNPHSLHENKAMNFEEDEVSAHS